MGKLTTLRTQSKRVGFHAVWSIPTVHTRYGKTYSFNVRIDVREDVKGPGWVSALLDHLQQIGESTPLPNVQIHRIKVAFEQLRGSKLFSRVASLPGGQLDKSSVFALFTELERRLQTSAYSTKAHVNSAFRTGFWNARAAFGLPPEVSRASVAFRTKLRVQRTTKELLGDYTTELPPLGATPHTNIADLRAKLRSRATSDLERIQAVLIAEMDAGDRLRSYLEACASSPIAIDTVCEVQELITTPFDHRRPKYQHLLRDMPTYIGAMVICLRANEMAQPGCTLEIRYPRQIQQHLVEQVQWTGAKRDLIYASELAMGEEINAAGMLLQSHTGWNLASVASLGASGIKIHNDLWEIQSFKSKVGEYTPPVYLGSKDAGAEQAISLLLWNHARLIALKHKEHLDDRLWWCGFSRRGDGRMEPQHVVGELRRKYGLPPFTMEMFRRQQIFLESLNSAEHAKRLAGHRSVATTGIYMNTDVARRMNSAINLEMQVRLQSELRYAIGAAAGKPTWRPMLIPVGDGSSCLNPRAPLLNEVDEDGTCPAILCHSGDGCSNRHVIINEDRMREALITRRFYENNWKRLHSRNHSEFSTIHIPRIAFNSALLDLIEKGPFAYVLREIKNEIDS